MGLCFVRTSFLPREALSVIQGSESSPGSFLACGVQRPLASLGALAASPPLRTPPLHSQASPPSFLHIPEVLVLPDFSCFSMWSPPPYRVEELCL